MSSTRTHRSVLVGHHEVRVELRAHGEELHELAAAREGVDHRRQGGVGEPVAVRREEHVLVVEVALDRLQALGDLRLRSGVDERDPPVADVARVELDAGVGPVHPEREVVEQRLVVAEEVLLDHVSLVPEAEDEVVVPPGRVVPHDVPEDRPVADRDHRLRRPLGLLAHADAEPPAEEHDLHPRLRVADIALTVLTDGGSDQSGGRGLPGGERPCRRDRGRPAPPPTPRCTRAAR